MRQTQAQAAEKVGGQLETGNRCRSDSVKTTAASLSWKVGEMFHKAANTTAQSAGMSPG